MKHYVVTWRNINDDSSLSIKVYSKFTCITGDSGIGKTRFFAFLEGAMIRDYDSESLVDFDVEDRYIEASVSDPSIKFMLWIPEDIDVISERLNQNDVRYIFLIDEFAMLKSSMLDRIRNSQHMFICISRSMPLRADYPLWGIYNILYLESSDGFGSFDIKPIKPLPIATNFENRYTTVITEASKGKSESQMFDYYKIPHIASGGRDRVPRMIKYAKGLVLVLSDLGNIGYSYDRLIEICNLRGDVYFYNYVCFEQLLYASDLVKNLPPQKYPFTKSVFDVLSPEVYFEYLLKVRTAGTELAYDHKKPLVTAYLKKGNFYKLFSSKVALGLRTYIENFGVVD